mmetsp:Transcript_103492/g.299440  ORF Transcript_103492/g.299440 Transcript_103492/m.299440 type:complete len:502 (+) Transcript_103492:175-1680(+)
MVVGMEQVHRVVDRQADHRDEEDALILSQAPADDRDEAQEDDRDADDVHEAQESDPPVPRGEQNHDKGDHQRQQDTHHRGLDHLVLSDHELVQVRRVEATDVAPVVRLELAPSLVPAVRLLHRVLRREGRIEADPRKLELRLVGRQTEAGKLRLEKHVVLPAHGVHRVLAVLHVRGEPIASQVADKFVSRKPGVVVFRLRAVADRLHWVEGAVARRAGNRRLANTLRSGDVVRPVLCEDLHEAVAAVLATQVVGHIDPRTLRGRRALGAAARAALPEDEATAVLAPRVLRVLAEVRGAAEAQQLELAGLGCYLRRLGRVIVDLLGAVRVPFRHGLLGVQAEGEGRCRHAEDRELLQQDFKATDRIEALAAERVRLLGRAQHGAGDRGHRDYHDDPEGDEEPPRPIEEIEQRALAEPLQGSFHRRAVVRRELPDARLAEQLAATAGEAAAAAWTAALAGLLAARLRQVLLVQDYGRGEERDAEEPIHQYDDRSKNAKRLHLW